MDESVTVQIGQKWRTKAAGLNNLAKRWKSDCQYGEQLAERFGLQLQLVDAGPLTGNAKEFNTHGLKHRCYHKENGEPL
jgi:hypothetical protein